MQIPPTIAAEAALPQQNLQLSLIKKNAQQGQAIANIVEQAVQNAPSGGSRGTTIDITV